MKFIHGLFAFNAAFFLLAMSGHAETKDSVTILYDAFSDNKAVTKDWGFSALVEHDGKRILFDTGNNPEIFEHNVYALCELTRDALPFLRAKIQRYAFFVARHRIPPERSSPVNDTPIAKRIADAGRLNLDHVGAEPGQEGGRERSGNGLPEFKDLESCEGPGIAIQIFR